MELNEEQRQQKREDIKASMNKEANEMSEGSQEIDYEAELDAIVEELELEEETAEEFREIELDYADAYLNAKSRMNQGNVRNMRSNLKDLEAEHTTALMKLLSVEQYEMYQEIKMRVDTKKVPEE